MENNFDIQNNGLSLVDKMRPLSDLSNSLKVHVIDKFEITDHRLVWIINPKECNFPITIGGLRTVNGWLVREHNSDEVYEIVGVDLPDVNDEDRKMRSVSIIVKNRK